MSEINKRIEALEAELQKLKNEVKPKYEENKWYKSKTNQLVFITEFRDYDVIGYGFGNKNDWFDISEWMDDWKSLELRLATHQEVKKALIEEAKKKGFKEGVYTDGKIGSTPIVKMDIFNEWNYSHNILELYGCCIFRDGVWAEIVKDEPIKIGGVECVIDSCGAYFDKNQYSWEELESLIKLFKNHTSQVKSLNVGCKGQYVVDLNLIEKIFALKK